MEIFIVMAHKLPLKRKKPDEEAEGQMTQIFRQRRRNSLAAIFALAVGRSEAAPIEGEVSSNAAALLVLLGIWALFTGLRDLRKLRHKRLVPERDYRTGDLRRPRD